MCAVTEKIQILSTLIISSALLLASLFTVITNSQVLNDRDDLNLTEYYRDYQVSHSGIVQPYQIKNMNIHLGTTWGFKADVEFLLKNNGKGSIDELIFSLFHELQVKEILIDGQRTNFTHEGDRLVVQLEKTLNSDDQVNVNIDYKGLNTSFYLANQQAIYLPNYFNWLPSINDKPSFTTVGKAGLLGRVNHQLNQKVSYHLTLQHNGKDVFTNLDQVDDSEWIAENSNGITLISGSLDRFEKNDVAFVLPSTWRDAMNGFETLQTDLISIINLYNDAQLSIENIPVPDKIFFVPNVRVSDGSELQGTWYSDDHLILGINTLLEPKSTFFIDYRESILLAITNGILLQNPYRSNIIDNDFSLLYRAYLTDIIFEQLEYVGVEEFNRTVQFEINDVEQDDKRTAVDYLYAFRENPISDDLNHPFYKEWTKLLELKDPWEELINLLENVGDLH